MEVFGMKYLRKTLEVNGMIRININTWRRKMKEDSPNYEGRRMAEYDD